MEQSTALQNDDQLQNNIDWDQLEFNAKDNCYLENGKDLILKGNEFHPNRVLASLNVHNAITIINALTEKFKEVEEKVHALLEEFNTEKDILRLKGKIEKTKNYLSQANALGNYAPFFEKINHKESEIANQLDLNYQTRAAIVAKAETLNDPNQFKEGMQWKDINESFKQLIEEWKQAPLVEKEKNDVLWSKIDHAKNQFFEQKRIYQEDKDKEMMNNLDLKMEICEQSEALAQSEAWKETTDKYKELMDRWKTIGRVSSIEKNDDLWNRFTTARNLFYDRKKDNFEKIQNEQNDNLALKTALVEKAELMCKRTDWKEATVEFNNFMEEWKQIGKVPYEKADELWARLQTAKDYFYNAKRQQVEVFKVTLEDNYAQKKALVDRINTIKDNTDWKNNTEEINELMNEWKKVGPIPKEYGDQLWEEFISARQYFFKRKDEDRELRKQRFFVQINSRLEQSNSFLQKLESAQKEDEDQIQDYELTISNHSITDAKDDEIAQNLQRLMIQSKERVAERMRKIEEVKQQIIELEQKKSEQ